MLARLRARAVAWLEARQLARHERMERWRYEQAELRLFSALCAHRYMVEDIGINDIDYMCADCGAWRPLCDPAFSIVRENERVGRRIAVGRLALYGHDGAVRKYMATQC